MQRFTALPSISNPGQNSIVPRGKNSGRASFHKKALRRKYAKTLKKEIQTEFSFLGVKKFQAL